MTFIETAKRYGGLMIVMVIIFYVIALMVLQLMAAAVQGFPKLSDGSPDPYVYHGDHPRSDETGCVMVGGLEVCPREDPNAGDGSDRSSGAMEKPLPVKVQAGDVSKVSYIPRGFHETRLQASGDIVEAVGLVAHVLQADNPIDVYIGRFTNGPAAYARSVGFSGQYEIVFSENFVSASDSDRRITWPVLGLVAHEVAHTIYDEGWGEDRMSNEASAEYQAGVAIYRLGGNLEDSFEFSGYFSGTSDVHPTPGLSTVLSREGWYQEKARHEGTADQCKSQIIGHRFSYKSKTCHYVFSCSRRKRPIKVACEHPDGKWKIQ